MREGMKWTGGGILALVLVALLMVVGAAFAIFGNFLGGEVAERSNPYKEKSILFDPNNSIGQYESPSQNVLTKQVP